MRDSMNQNCTLFKKEISSGDMMIYDHLGTWWVFFDFMSWQNELEDEDKEEEEEEGSLGLPGCFIFSGEGGLVSVETCDFVASKEVGEDFKISI